MQIRINHFFIFLLFSFSCINGKKPNPKTYNLIKSKRQLMANISKDTQYEIFWRAIEINDTELLKIALEQPNSIFLKEALTDSVIKKCSNSTMPEIYFILAENIKVQDYRHFILDFNCYTSKENDFIRLLIERFGVIDLSHLTHAERKPEEQSQETCTNKTQFPTNTELELIRTTRMKDYLAHHNNVIPYDYALGKSFLLLKPYKHRLGSISFDNPAEKKSRIQIFEDRYKYIQDTMLTKATTICKYAVLCFTRKNLLQDEHLIPLIFERILNTTPYSYWEELYSIMVQKQQEERRKR